MIAHAAAIADVLTVAGRMDTGAVSHWFNHPRRELGWLSPHQALEITPAAQRKVLDLARSDIAELDEIEAQWGATS